MTFSEKALAAIDVAVKNQEPIADLEFLNVSPRTISILQENGIVTMDELMQKTPEELCAIKFLGSHSVQQLIECLKMYDQLPKRRDLMISL